MPTLTEDHTPEEKQPQSESWEERYKEKFDGIYYGKDWDGMPLYPPTEYVVAVKDFIRSEIQKAEQRGHEKGREESGLKVETSFPRSQTCGCQHQKEFSCVCWCHKPL